MKTCQFFRRISIFGKTPQWENEHPSHWLSTIFLCTLVNVSIGNKIDWQLQRERKVKNGPLPQTSLAKPDAVYHPTPTLIRMASWGPVVGERFSFSRRLSLHLSTFSLTAQRAPFTLYAHEWMYAAGEFLRLHVRLPTRPRQKLLPSIVSAPKFQE
jgi:hypothetical protein